jgi:ferredoxin
MSIPLPIGCHVRIQKPELRAVIDSLRATGYRVIGPTVAQAAVAYAEIASIHELPIGWTDDQEAGHYRIKQTEGDRYFDYVVGPQSLKNYLFPAHCIVLETTRVNGRWRVEAPAPPRERLAFLGVRACDLQALHIQDRVFLGGAFTDPHYQARREGLFVLAVSCGRSAPTCFCAAMNTGPAVAAGADLVLTELPDQFFLQVCTESGAQLLDSVRWQPCSAAEVAEAHRIPQLAAQQQHRTLDARSACDALLANLEHPRWDEVAARCLSCGNCTLVCPTCFCSSVQEVTDLSGERVQRERLWDSCFNEEHSYMNSGTVRKSTRSRYRQWLTHKLATWLDQFGTSGCVGCGRCITWCPVGIDLTEEVAAIGGKQP